MGKFSERRTNLRGHTTLFNGTAMDPRTTQSSPLLASPSTFGRYTGEKYKNVSKEQIDENKKG